MFTILALEFGRAWGRKVRRKGCKQENELKLLRSIASCRMLAFRVSPYSVLLETFNYPKYISECLNSERPPPYFVKEYI